MMLIVSEKRYHTSIHVSYMTLHLSQDVDSIVAAELAVEKDIVDYYQ